MNNGSILNMPEDLLDEAQLKQRSKSKAAQSRHETNQRNQPESKFLLDALVSETANALGIAIEELRNWIQDAALPEAVLKTILVTTKCYQLNPLLGQIDWELNLDGSYEVYIPIDGWITLIHRQPTFQGITFDQSPESENGIPIWMECTIFRSDLNHHTTVREYYAELKTEHPIWQQMPRRMLRHKTLQQCARLAFGINPPVLRAPFMLPTAQKLSAVHPNQGQPDRKTLLKKKLIMNEFRS
jgi:hypothetical protein